MNKQNLAVVFEKPVERTPWFSVKDGFYPAVLVDVCTSGKDANFRFRYTFGLLDPNGDPLLEKPVEVGGRKTKKENLKQITLIRTTSPSMQEGSKRRQILEALPRGQDMFGIIPLEEMLLSDIIGSPVTVLVKNSPNKNGQVYSNIEEVFPADMKWRRAASAAITANA